MVSILLPESTYNQYGLGKVDKMLFIILFNSLRLGCVMAILGFYGFKYLLMLPIIDLSQLPQLNLRCRSAAAGGIDAAFDELIKVLARQQLKCCSDLNKSERK